MSLVHLHLMLNHIPVVGALFLIALFAAGTLRGNPTLVRTALWTCVVLGVVALLTFLTGEPAEEAVEGLAGTSEGAIERHEEAALVATFVLGAASVLSVAALVRLRGSAEMPRWVGMAGLVGSLVVATAMGVTAGLGGDIRHTEIRSGATASSARPESDRDARDRDERDR